MKIKQLPFLLFVLLCISGYSQEFQFSSEKLSTTDSLFLSNLPELKLSETYKSTYSKDLPAVLDNRQLPYFRSIFSQYGWSCGQASTVGYTFTYEINRLRNLASDTDSIMYHPSFTFNYFNKGEDQVGVCYYNSYDAIKKAGNPSIYEFGQIDTGLTVWMDSYDKYYSAMQNKLDELYSIYVGDEEGLLTLKHWLYSHLDESENGGLANFYTDLSGFTFLPEETPEEGKAVITYFGQGTGHSMTFIGWNDSVRYDYNEDGEYTNDIDINDDGIVTMKDWEIGGLILANSHGINWADSGYSYVMYKVLAEEKNEGGIWNKSVNVIDIKKEYSPMLTLKIELKHDSRNKIKVIAGIASDTTNLIPEKTIEFPIFNFQGGNNYMQGNYTDEWYKTLEFGLDVTPLLSYVEINEPHRFFVQVIEHDPNNEGTGELLAFSLMDYMNEMTEIKCLQMPIPLVENGITTASVVHTVNTELVTIDVDEIPPFVSGQPYSIQMVANGGKEPYQWEITHNYIENQEESSYPNIDEEQLIPTNNIEGYSEKVIDFPFPFYGKTYDTILVHTDGFIMFRKTDLPLPYQVDDLVLLKYETMIAPFLQKELLIASPEDKLLYEGNEEYAAFRWKENVLTENGMILVDFTTILYPDGLIEFYYSNLQLNEIANWVTGLSQGNGKNFHVFDFANLLPIETDMKISYLPENNILQMNINEEGLIEALPNDETQIYTIGVQVTDDNEISNTKSYQLSSGLTYEYSMGGNQINYGDTVNLNFTITNTSAQQINELSLNANLADDYLYLIDNSEVIGQIESGQSIQINNAIAIDVSEFVPDKHSVNLSITFSSTEQDWVSGLILTAYSPKLSVQSLIINDGDNNKLDQGDTANLIIPIKNTGHASISNVTGQLETSNPYITFLFGQDLNFGSIQKGATKYDTVTITVDENAPIGQIAVFNLEVNAMPIIQIQESFELLIGRKPILIIELDPGNISGLSLQSALEELEITFDYTGEFTYDINEYQNVFITLGRKYLLYELSEYQGLELASFLNFGGNLYMEGGGTWDTDQPTEVHPMFQIGIDTISWQEMDSVFGIPNTFTNGMQFSYSGQLPYYDYYLVPEANAYTVFQGEQTGHAYMVANDNGDYKTVGSMINYGSLDDGEYPSTKTNLIAAILEFFGMVGLITSEDGINIRPNNSDFICFPNPSSGKTSFNFEMDEPGLVSLDIISISGEEKTKVISGIEFPKGQNRIDWNGLDAGGNQLAPGVYISRLITGNESSIIKLIIN